MGLSGEPGQEPYSLSYGLASMKPDPHEGLGRGALTLLMLQKMRRSSNQKKTAMTPVPIRIMISMLPLSWEPAWTERSCACVHAVGEGVPCGKCPGFHKKELSEGGMWRRCVRGKPDLPQPRWRRS